MTVVLSCSSDDLEVSVQIDRELIVDDNGMRGLSAPVNVINDLGEKFVALKEGDRLAWELNAWLEQNKAFEAQVEDDGLVHVYDRTRRVRGGF
jgi:hypothetical protein